MIVKDNNDYMEIATQLAQVLIDYINKWGNFAVRSGCIYFLALDTGGLSQALTAFAENRNTEELKTSLKRLDQTLAARLDNNTGWFDTVLAKIAEIEHRHKNLVMLEAE